MLISTLLAVSGDRPRASGMQLVQLSFKMKQLLILLSWLVLAAAVSSPGILGCSKLTDDDARCMDNITINSKSPDIHSFPAEPSIHFKNCTIDYFSPEVAAKLSDVTTELSIVDGSALKFYVKPTLKTCTIQRSGTESVVIDPVDNLNLNLLDIDGALRAVPNNVHRLKRLAVLNLCGNQMDHISFDLFSGMDRLRKINLGHNNIQSVSFTNDVSLPALTELFLNGNALAQLDFSRLVAPNLQQFHVSQNHLTQIDDFPERFGKLTRADLFQNKWRCAWLDDTLKLLNRANVDTLSFIPGCDESGTVRVPAVDCEAD